MKQYRVIALSVSGKGSKIHKSGEVVYSNNFAEGRAEILCKSGFLKEIGVVNDAPIDNTPSEPINFEVKHEVEVIEEVKEKEPVKSKKSKKGE